MFRLPADEFGRISPRYLAEPAFFPLIAAVLDHSQDGAVWVDNAMQPRQVYVEHAFGFAQIFGPSAAAFETDLEAYFSRSGDASAAKIRLYTPHAPAFLHRPEFLDCRSERQRFTRVWNRARGTVLADLPDPIGMRDTDEIQARFGVVTRFWRSAEQFVRASRAHIVRRAGTIVAVCYAAAIAGGKAEIDIVTDPAFRRQGLGRQAASGCIASCIAAELEPVWDCFTNNLPSVRTALSLGFSPHAAPYPFFTIPRT